MTQERLNTILSWNRHPSCKEDSMAGRILKYLVENEDTEYRILVKNERFNYTRNLNNMKEIHRQLMKGLGYIKEKVIIYSSKDCFKAEAGKANDVRLHTMNSDPDNLAWGIYKFNTSNKGEGLTKGTRWMTQKEHLDYYNKQLKERKITIKKHVQAEMKIESKPGIFFEGTYPGEPNYSQLFAVLQVEGFIRKIKHGVYRITSKGKKISKSYC